MGRKVESAGWGALCAMISICWCKPANVEGAGNECLVTALL